MTDPIRIADLRQLAEQATHGDWNSDEDAIFIGDASKGEDEQEGFQDIAETWGPNRFENAKLIAAMNPEVVLALCDVAEAAHAFMELAEDAKRDTSGAIQTINIDRLRDALNRLDLTP